MFNVTETAELFLDLILADDEWVDAEFDAIVAVSWPRLRPPARPGPSGNSRPPAGQHRPANTAARLRHIRRGCVRTSAHGRERSPPW
jgi:hypothetical protein